MENWIKSETKSYFFCSSLIFYLSSRESFENSLALEICFGSSHSLSLSISHFSRSLHLLSKEIGSEQILFRRRAWLYGIPFLQWYGWHEEEWRYWWLSVALTYKSVVIFPSVNETETSKKLIDVWDHSAVNFIVRCFF